MILSRANLLAVKVAGADKRDPVLHQLHVDGDGTTVASNGRSMVAVEPVDGQPPAMPEFEEAEVPSEGIGVPVALVEEALRNVPRGSLGLGLGYAVVTSCSEDSVEFTTTDMNLNRKVEGRVERKRFPEWHLVFQKAKRKAGHRVCVDRRALLRLLQAIETACQGDPDHSTFIEFGEDEDDGFMVRSLNVETGQHVLGYMVPLKTGGQWLTMNDWERKVCARVIKKRRIAGEEEEE